VIESEAALGLDWNWPIEATRGIWRVDMIGADADMAFEAAIETNGLLVILSTL
jgi:hypothetical protein